MLQLAAAGLVLASLAAYLGVSTCGWNGAFCPDACARLERHLAAHLAGQELAAQELTLAVCDHIAPWRSPAKPLVVSLHGPVGVGKTLFHRLLAEALYNRTQADGVLCERESAACPGYRVVFGTNYAATEQEAQVAALQRSLVGHLARFPEAVLVIEEFDKADCASRGLLRQLLDKGTVDAAAGPISFARSVIVLESNEGKDHLFRLLAEAPSRAELPLETAQRVLKDVLYARWAKDGCEEEWDTQKTLSLIDVMVPFLPLERAHVRTVVAAHLRERASLGVAAGEFLSLRWDSAVLDFLTDRVELEGSQEGRLHAVEGAREVSGVLTRHTSGLLREAARGQHTPRALLLQEAGGKIALMQEG